ncbi:MAG: ABC transporter ATP-binding protein, partial [bacterium]
MDAIRTVNLTKKYKEKTAVDALNLTVREGELYALLGVNGAGKSTTIRMLSGLSRPTSGDALLLGHSIVTEASAAKASLSVSPQETAVAAKLSVRENLEFIAKVYGADRKEAQEKTDRVLREFSLEEYEKSPARTLSGGWQRRLSIAMALISEPKILFLDEPTLGLDVLA